RQRHLMKKPRIFCLIAIWATLLGAAPVLQAQDAQEPPAADAVATEAEAPDAVAEEAVAEEQASTGSPFLEKLVKGGITMLFLLIVSIVGVTFAIERFFNLTRKNIVPAGLADEARALWAKKD